MSEDIVGVAPTSTATTKETEPKVVAGISSAATGPGETMAIRTAGADFGFGRALTLLAVGLALGYGAARLIRGRE